jgi:PST family polysaccharide transporter
MGADFYPRLTANAQNNTDCNRLVNEQTEIGLLLAGPGVIATLTFAPVVIALFYSVKFGAAVEVLRWICLGTILQVITWPMSFIIVAKGKQAIYLGSELAWGVVSISLAWICVRWFGLKGAGVAFFGSYVFYGFVLLPIVRRLSGFRWSTANKRTGLLFLSLIAVVFTGFYVLPLLWAACIGTLAALMSAVYSVRVLVRLIPRDRIPGPIWKLLAGLWLVPPGVASVD